MNTAKTIRFIICLCTGAHVAAMNGPCQGTYTDACPDFCASQVAVSPNNLITACPACAGCLTEICGASSLTNACLSLCGVVTATTSQMQGCANCLEYALKATPDTDPTNACNLGKYGTCGQARSTPTQKNEGSIACADKTLMANCSTNAGAADACSADNQLFCHCLANFPGDIDRANDCVATCYPQAIDANGQFITAPAYLVVEGNKYTVEGEEKKLPDWKKPDQAGANACIKTTKALQLFATQTNLNSFVDADLENGDFALLSFNNLLLYAPASSCPPARLLNPQTPGSGALDFTNASLKYADFSGLDFTPNVQSGITKFDGAKLTNTLFVSANFPGVSFKNGILNGVDFQSATIDSAIFDGTIGTGLSAGSTAITNSKIINGSNLSSSDFTSASIGRLTVDNSNVSDSFFSLATQATILNADGSTSTYPFTLKVQNNSKMDNAVFTNAQLGGGMLTIKGSSATTSFWNGANITGAYLNGDFSSAAFNASPATAKNPAGPAADASGATFAATLFGADFNGANLTNVIVDLNNYNSFNSLWFGKNLDSAIGTNTTTSKNPAGEAYNSTLYNQILSQISSAQQPPSL